MMAMTTSTLLRGVSRSDIRYGGIGFAPMNCYKEVHVCFFFSCHSGSWFGVAIISRPDTIITHSVDFCAYLQGRVDSREDNTDRSTVFFCHIKCHGTR